MGGGSGVCGTTILKLNLCQEANNVGCVLQVHVGTTRLELVAVGSITALHLHDADRLTSAVWAKDTALWALCTVPVLCLRQPAGPIGELLLIRSQPICWHPPRVLGGDVLCCAMLRHAAVVSAVLFRALLPCVVLCRCSEVLKYGRYTGFTSLGIVFQTMDNTHLRRALGMKNHQTGVLLNRIQPTTSTAKVGGTCMVVACRHVVHLPVRKRLTMCNSPAHHPPPLPLPPAIATVVQLALGKDLAYCDWPTTVFVRTT